MIVLLDTSEDLATCKKELGDGFEVGQLLTPLSGFKNRGGPFAIDNGAFAGFNAKSFLRRLKREEPNRERCLFVVVPDVVGSARRTNEVFVRWAGRLSAWPLAYVLQDGVQDVPIPWDAIAAVFVGGSTAFKCSDAALQAASAARALGRWVHVGRVNTPERLNCWIDVADSIDGSGIARYSHMRRNLGCAEPLFERQRP